MSRSLSFLENMLGLSCAKLRTAASLFSLQFLAQNKMNLFCIQNYSNDILQVNSSSKVFRSLHTICHLLLATCCFLATSRYKHWCKLFTFRAYSVLASGYSLLSIVYLLLAIWCLLHICYLLFNICYLLLFISYLPGLSKWSYHGWQNGISCPYIWLFLSACLS